MASLLDRLLGRTADAKAVVVDAKAVTGAGAFALDYYPSISSFSRDQNKLMNEALALYRSNPWVHIAEKTVADRFARLEWHLENANGDTISEDQPGISPAELMIAALIERPTQNKTRRQTWGLLSRHLGLAGNHFWYLDQRNLQLAGNTPLQLLPLNPVRMTPRIDGNGDLLGWVIDGPDNRVTGRPGNQGMPVELNEVIHFTLDEPDFGIWGIGIAEAAQTKIELDRLATHHEAMIFASGGRLTGLVSPKVNPGVEISTDQWNSLVREWRNVASDPDAAKRLIVARGPVDFTPTSSSNEQLQLAELSGQGRDDILNAWGIPLTQIGITKAVGLNSGEKNKNDEAILWQGVIEPRVDAFREKVQFELLDRFAAAGGPQVQLIIETPEFDDSVPLFDMVIKSLGAPMTNDERRSVIGLDPLDETIYGELGSAVYVLNTMTALYDPMAPAPPPVQVAPATPLLETAPPGVLATTGLAAAGKATIAAKPLLGLRAKLQPTWERKVRAEVAAVLGEQRGMISDNVRQRYAAVTKKPKDHAPWWNAERWDNALYRRLDPIWDEYSRTVARRTTRVLNGHKAGPDWMTNVIDKVRTNAGVRIVGINDTTRQRVADLVEQGVTDGLGPADLGDLIEGDAIFDEARAELIARTETALVYNEAALGSYSEFGVEEVEAVDGDEDEECAQRNGEVYSLDDAAGIEDHPNGTLDWIPVVPEEAKADVKADLMFELAKAALSRPDPSPPSITFAVGAFQAHAAPISVTAPEVSVHLPEPKPVHRRIERDPDGTITGMTED